MAPEADAVASVRLPAVPGVLNGSRLLEQPEYRREIEAFRTFVHGDDPILVEIGFDHGRRLHSTARANPGWRIVGLEVRKKRVVEAIARARRDEIENVLPWRIDARTVFAGVMESHSIDVVEVLFPTPWLEAGPKRKRLLLTERFLHDVNRALRVGGLLHFATDVADYAEHVKRVLAGMNELESIPVTLGDSLRPPCAQLSRREWKCERDGLFIHRFYFRRIKQPTMSLF